MKKVNMNTNSFDTLRIFVEEFKDLKTHSRNIVAKTFQSRKNHPDAQHPVSCF